MSCNDGVLKIRDLGSRNGTYINGKRIDEATVKAGDYLKIGPLTFLLQINGQPEKISLPEGAVQKPPKQKEQAAKAALDEDSFAEMETDESDPFLAELEDI